MEAPIPYSFHELGFMPVQRDTIAPDGLGVQHTEDLRIDAAAFDPKPINTLDYNSETHKSWQSGAGCLSYDFIDRASGKLAIQALAWGGTVENAVTRHETYRIADALPEHSLISLNMPGHGADNASSHWPFGARSQMLTRGSFEKAGQHLAHFLKNDARVKQAETIDILGTSTGARSAITLAANLGKTIENLVLFDPPGSTDFKTTEFIKRFLHTEAAHGRGYRAESRDQQHVEVMDNAPRRVGLDYAKKFIGRDALAAYDFYIGEVAALSRPALDHDLRNVGNVKRVVVLSPLQSALNNPDNMEETLLFAQNHNPQTQFENYTFKGTHTITRMASTVLAELFKLGLYPETGITPKKNL